MNPFHDQTVPILSFRSSPCRKDNISLVKIYTLLFSEKGPVELRTGVSMTVLLSSNNGLHRRQN